MSIIREKNHEINDSIHEVVKDIEERGHAYRLPNVGMHESIGQMLMGGMPVKLISLMPEDLHAFSWDETVSSNGAVCIYKRETKDNPRGEFKKHLTITIQQCDFTLSRLSLAVGGFFFFIRDWFVADADAETEDLAREWAAKYWPGFEDDAVSLVNGLVVVHSIKRGEDGNLPEKHQSGIYTFS